MTPIRTLQGTGRLSQNGRYLATVNYQIEVRQIVAREHHQPEYQPHDVELRRRALGVLLVTDGDTLLPVDQTCVLTLMGGRDCYVRLEAVNPPSRHFRLYIQNLAQLEH